MQIKNRRHIAYFVAFVGLLGLMVVNGTNWLFLPADVFWAQMTLANMQVAAMTLSLAPYFALKMLQLHRLSQELEFSVNHDNLTRVSTRAHMDRMLTSEHLWPATIIVCDLDRFKQVNDTYGHLVGDLVLQHFADIAQRNIRETDLLARFGGEEFVIVLPRSFPKGGMRLANDIRTALTENPMPYKGEVIRVTASFGVAFAEDAKNYETAIMQADQALYTAKSTGRNKVVPADTIEKAAS